MKTPTHSFVSVAFVATYFFSLLGVAVSTAAAATEPVSAAVSDASSAVPTSYRFKVGAFACWILYDSQGDYSPASFFVNAAPTELEPALRQHGGTKGKISTPYAGLLVKTPTNTILIDTGAGPSANGKAPHLQANLAAVGVTPDQIDTVLLTHAHLDHIGGTILADGSPAFPRARFVMFRPEWDFWTGEHPDLSTLAVSDGARKQFVDIARKQLLPLRDRMELIDHDMEVRPGIHVVLAAGHTPGHMVVKLASEGEQLLYVADLVLSPIALEHPEWHTRYELDVAQSQAAKLRTLAMAADENMLVYAMHFPWPGLGHVRPAGDHWTWQPVVGAP